MEFWRTQQGPRYSYDPSPRSIRDARCMGVVYCPICDNAMAYLYDDAEGIAVHAWVPARGQAPGDPNGQSVGWALYALVEGEMPDDVGSVLNCWRGHNSLRVTAGDCRAIADTYRTKGSVVRRPARTQPLQS